MCAGKTPPPASALAPLRRPSSPEPGEFRRFARRRRFGAPHRSGGAPDRPTAGRKYLVLPRDERHRLPRPWRGGPSVITLCIRRQRSARCHRVETTALASPPRSLGWCECLQLRCSCSWDTWTRGQCTHASSSDSCLFSSPLDSLSLHAAVPVTRPAWLRSAAGRAQPAAARSVSTQAAAARSSSQSASGSQSEARFECCGPQSGGRKRSLELRELKCGDIGGVVASPAPR